MRLPVILTETRLSIAQEMLRGPFLSLCILCTFGAPASLANDLPRGVEGAVPVPFSARNVGAEPIACIAELAHWFSADLGEAAPGATIEATLWSDIASGEIFLENAAGDRMPVQALWCGLARAPFATRWSVPLPRRAGDIPSPIALACAPDRSRLVCR